MTGLAVVNITPAMTASTCAGADPISRLPASRFGQETFTSSASKLASDSSSGNSRVIVDHEPADAHDQRRPELPVAREYIAEEPRQTGARNPHRIQHPVRRFRQAVGRICRNGHLRKSSWLPQRRADSGGLVVQVQPSTRTPGITGLSSFRSPSSTERSEAFTEARIAEIKVVSMSRKCFLSEGKKGAMV